ncbi:MAG: protein-tyrosine phosphatase family protein [Candidatus Acidiferrales bacterium]
MNRFASRRALGFWVLAAALFLGASSARSQTAQNPEGVRNFARVTDTLYRGAQPSSAGFNALRHMGVGIVVNFRNEADETSNEKREVESLGMKYVGIPWSGRDNPSDALIVQFLDLLRANPQTKIFVHCRRGADRTGTMVAAYRIVVQHEPVPDVVSEMHSFHYDHFFLPQLQRYVVSLPRLLHDDPMFATYIGTPNLVPGVLKSSISTKSPN